VKPRHVAVAVMIAAIWGVNFVVIDVGLASLPPLLFAGLRFVAAAFPAVLFVRRPAIPWRWFALIGLPLGAGQFGLLFMGMHMGMPAGLSSLVLQMQALFTALLAAVMLHERPRPAQAAGMVVAFAGIALIGLTLGQGSPLLAFALCVAAAGMWGLANIGLRRAQPPDAFAFMVWVSLVPPIPLLALSLIFEGPRADLHALTHISPGGIGALLYIAYISTLVGYGAWGWLMRRYAAGQVAMYALLVPPFGMSSAALLLGEHVTAWDAVAALLIVGGVALGSLRRRTAPASAPASPGEGPQNPVRGTLTSPEPGQGHPHTTGNPRLGRDPAEGHA
jgi:O-acetylserine/cysteine efflux transporter